jgi:hypothetical protein
MDYSGYIARRTLAVHGGWSGVLPEYIKNNLTKYDIVLAAAEGEQQKSRALLLVAYDVIVRGQRGSLTGGKYSRVAKVWLHLVT